MFGIKVGASVALALLVPAVAQAKPPTQRHVHQYAHEYRVARHKFGEKVGCYLLHKPGYGSCHVKATDAKVVKSTLTLGRMLAPPPVIIPVATSSAVSTSTGSASTYSAPAGGGLVNCIIRVESSGSPTASNGSHSGLGGWSQTAWQQDGGTRYASSPTQASYSQQVQVLSNEGNSPQGFGQQTNFEPGHPCG